MLHNIRLPLSRRWVRPSTHAAFNRSSVEWESLLRQGFLHCFFGD